MATTKITNPDLFDLGSLNTALKLPSGTTAERPTSPSTGEWRYNTTTNLVEYYDGGSWRELVSDDIPPIASENFNTVLYTGNGSTQSITGVGFKPDMVWIKDTGRTREHILCDSTRGSEKELSPNTTDAQENRGVFSFDTDGFTFNDGNTNYNENGESYVAWCWKADGGTTVSNADGDITSDVQANTSAGFSIVKWTSTSSSSDTIGHGLGVKPDVVLYKKYSSTGSWFWYTDVIDGSWDELVLNDTSAKSDFAGTYATSTTFKSVTSSSGADWITYCFASKTGYSKIGIYTGTGASGNLVTTGFEPAWIMIKRSDSTGGWLMFDNKRNTSNPRNNRIEANSDQAEQTGSATKFVDFYSNGFEPQVSDSEINASGGTYTYMAFAGTPSTPTLADSFHISLYTGNATSSRAITGLGFKPDFVWIKNRSAVRDHMLFDSVRGQIDPPGLYSNLSNAQFSPTVNDFNSFDSDGFTIGQDSYTNGSGNDIVAWSWKANSVPSINTDGTIQSLVSSNQAAGFSIVMYTGNGSAGATIGHGLGAAPQMVLNKRLDQAASWNVFHTSLSTNHIMKLESSNAAFDASAGTNGGGFTVDATKLTIVGGASTQNNNNANGGEYIAYCFTSISGYSSIGGYTGVSSGVTITTGFRPSFMFIKSSSNVENWAILDTDRGSGKALNPNLSDAESDSALNTFTVSDTGFSFPDQSIADAMLNENGYEYIYWAVAENPSPVVPAGQMAYLVVAGGAGGGGTVFPNKGGGGGAGGLRTSFGTTSGGGASAESNITLSYGTYTITVGAGGGAAANGAASSISGGATVSTVGGGQGGAISVSGTAGGSGGGMGGNNTGGLTGGAGTAGEGFDGGTTGGNAGYDGSGGGGAAQAGGNGGFRNTTGGVGGNGLEVSITGTGTYYAGGGGGGSDSLSVGPRPGGLGGGGAGGSNAVVGGNGTANLGGGAGAGGEGAQPGSGGSGVVILRLRTSDYSGTTTGSPTVTTTGEETILTFTGSGTYVHS